MDFAKLYVPLGLLLLELLHTGLSQCPGGEWKQLNGRCFLIKVGGAGDFKTHADAELTCKQLNGGQASLATIHSQEENDFIYNEAAKIMGGNERMHMWLDMRKTTYQAGFPYFWADKSLVNYVNWDVGEPNDFDGTQNCVRMYEFNGKWDDFDCRAAGTETLHGYICQDKPVTYDESNNIEPPIYVGKEGCCSTGDVFAILFGIIFAVQIVLVVLGYLYFYKWDRKLPWKSS